ncbi:protein Ysy6p [Diutina catenulata]
MALQTPKQRAANARFEKKNVNQWGKKKVVKQKTEFPISRGWIAALVFLVCGGAVLEIIRLLF